MSWWRNYLFIPPRKPVFTRELVVSFGFKCKYHWRWYTQGSILSVEESTIVHRKLNAKPVSNTTDHVYCQHIGQLNIRGKFNKQIRWNPSMIILIHSSYFKILNILHLNNFSISNKLFLLWPLHTSNYNFLLSLQCHGIYAMSLRNFICWWFK